MRFWECKKASCFIPLPANMASSVTQLKRLVSECLEPLERNMEVDKLRCRNLGPGVLRAKEVPLPETL